MRGVDSLYGGRGREQSGRVPGGQTPQAESVQVRFDCYAVQHDRASDGLRTDWYGTELPCVSQHDHVRQDRVAMMLISKRVCVQYVQMILADSAAEVTGD